MHLLEKHGIEPEVVKRVAHRAALREIDHAHQRVQRLHTHEGIVFIHMIEGQNIAHTVAVLRRGGKPEARPQALLS